MAKNSIYNQKIEKVNFVEEPLLAGDYDTCEFINCNLGKASLAHINFTDCSFVDCDLSLARITNAAFRDVQFIHSKLLGIHFETCHHFLFTASFKNCNLNHSSFYQMKLKQIILSNSTLHEVDFTEADLGGVVFDQCDLTGATFENTLLEKADFRTAFNYTINPEKNRIKKAKFSLNGVAGLLNQYDIVID